MSRFYDIAERMKAGKQKPTVKIDEDHEYNINTSKSAVLFVQAISMDETKKDMEKTDELIKVTLGEEALEYINAQDMPMPNISLIVTVIMAAIADVTLEDAEETAREEAKRPRKKSK